MGVKAGWKTRWQEWRLDALYFDTCPRKINLPLFLPWCIIWLHHKDVFRYHYKDMFRCITRICSSLWKPACHFLSLSLSLSHWVEQKKVLGNGRNYVSRSHSNPCIFSHLLPQSGPGPAWPPASMLDLVRTLLSLWVHSFMKHKTSVRGSIPRQRIRDERQEGRHSGLFAVWCGRQAGNVTLMVFSEVIAIPSAPAQGHYCRNIRAKPAKEGPPSGHSH